MEESLILVYNKGYMYKIKKENMLNKKGFTLIEILIVIMIIGILSGVLFSVLNVKGLRQKTRDSQRISDLKKMQTALELYFADYRTYPVSDGWTHISGSDEVSDALSGGGYINKMPTDPSFTSGGEDGCSSQVGYMYKSLGGGYIITTQMEVPTSTNNSPCSELNNWDDSCSPLDTCYGVENPL